MGCWAVSSHRPADVTALELMTDQERRDTGRPLPPAPAPALGARGGAIRQGHRRLVHPTSRSDRRSTAVSPAGSGEELARSSRRSVAGVRRGGDRGGGWNRSDADSTVEQGG